jgi:protein-tyrosine phosphatase
MRSVLFLCTGNYYRSRFAEELFNYYAYRDRLNWMAQSRALAIEHGKENFGPLSPFVLKALKERGLVARGSSRYPQQCAVADLKDANLIIALKESEHRRLIIDRFPGWENRAEYWQVDDVGEAPPAVALCMIEAEVEAMLRQLRQIRSL